VVVEEPSGKTVCITEKILVVKHHSPKVEHHTDKVTKKNFGAKYINTQ